MEAVTVDGAVPAVAEMLSQLPPSPVLTAPVQFNVPVPPFLIWMLWDGAGPPPGISEKLNCPAVSSKNVLPAAATIRVTGTVMVMVGVGYEENTTCPM